MSDTEKKDTTETIDPGPTPGSAEGTENEDDQSKREPAQTARTPDQAEGEEKDA